MARMSKKQLCDHTSLKPGHLADALHRRKGVSQELVESMATVLRCRPETLAPELTGSFAAIRLGDVDDGRVPAEVAC